jgi:putative transposase
LNRNKQLGSRKKGIRASNRAKKFYGRQAKLHAKVANQRNDYLQKVTTEISEKYYRIRVEDLNVKGMVANHKLAGAISDLGFYEFRRLLVYKQAHYGTKVEIVDRWYPSSKLCSQCGAINQTLTLKDRTFECNCGLLIDRDLQAAINLLTAPVDRVVG